MLRETGGGRRRRQELFKKVKWQVSIVVVVSNDAVVVIFSKEPQVFILVFPSIENSLGKRKKDLFTILKIILAG